METPLNIANLCNNIKPGDITHEAVRQSFNEYFGTFNRRLKVYIRQDGSNVLQQLPCFVLKVCRQQVKNCYYLLSYCRYRLMNAECICWVPF